MVYDGRTGTLDMSKRKVMNLPQNSKVYLPAPLNPTPEAGLAVKKQELMSTFKEFMSKSCDDRGKQKATSLNKSKRKGLANLKKRSKEGGLFFLETDKNNKFAAVDQDTYLKMGARHTCKDTVITQQEAEGIQGKANMNVSMWIKMLGMGRLGAMAKDQESCVVPPMKLLSRITRSSLRIEFH